MADDIAALLAKSAKTDANFNFGDINKSYWEGLEGEYKKRTRDAFQDPSLYDANGNIIPGKVLGQALRTGGLPAANEAKTLIEGGLIQQRIEGDDRLRRSEEEPPVRSPPSTSQSGAPKQAAPDLTQPQARPQTKVSSPTTPGGPDAGPFDQFLAFQKVPAELRGQANTEIQKEIMLRTGRPFAPANMTDPAMRSHVKDALATFAHKWAASGQAPQQQAPPQAAPFEPTRIGSGPVPPPATPGAVPGMGPGGAAAAVPPAGAPQPPVAVPPPDAQQPPPQPPPQPQVQAQAPIQPRPVQTQAITPESQIPPSLRGVITPRDMQQHGSVERVLEFYEKQLRYNISKEQFDRVTSKVAAIRAALAPTETMRAAESRGMTPEQYAREQERVKSEEVLTKDVDVPTLKEGLEKGKAAREEIRVYHQAKDVLNQPGGIIAGAGGDQLLAMAKIAGKYLGIPAAERAANRTEAFRAIMSGGVLQTVKQLGAGSGITNADVKFASDMVGKSLTLDENSIRRIIHLSEKVARRKIADHNANVDQIVRNNPALVSRAQQFRIEAPPLRIRVSKTPHIGDVRMGREYVGGPIRSDSSWIDAEGSPDTLRVP